MGLILAVCLMASWSNGGWASNPPAVASAVLTVERTAYTEADDVEYGVDLADLLALPEPESLAPMGAKTDPVADPVQPTDRGYDGRTYWLRDRYGQVWTGPVWSDLWDHVQRTDQGPPATEAATATQVQYAPACQYLQGADGRIYRQCPR